MAGRVLVKIGSAAVLLTGLAGAALAQVPAAPTNPVQPQSRDPSVPGPQNTVPEKMDSTRPTETLSDRLERSDGVIKPPDVGSGMTVRPPVPDPGTTPVIPPPGSPGGNSRLDPR